MEQYNVIELSQKIKDYYDGLNSEDKRGAYLVIGNLGAGKSTLISYLMDRKFVRAEGLKDDVAIPKDEFWDTVVKDSFQDINASNLTENAVVLTGKELKKTVYFVQNKRLVLASNGDPFRFEYELSEDQQDLLNYSNFDSCEKQIDSSLDIGVFKLNRAIRQKAAVSQPILFKPQNEYPDIGYENTSATFYPKLYSRRLQEKNQNVFCDSPGFLSDRLTIEERVCESLFTEIMFKAVENIKGILVVIDVNSITTDRGNGLKGLARILDKLFKNTEDLKKSVLIVITRCKKGTRVKQIIQNINNTIMALTKTNSDGNKNNQHEVDQGVIAALSFLKNNENNVVIVDVFDDGNSRNEIFKLLQKLEIAQKNCFDFGNVNETRRKFNDFLAAKLYEANEWIQDYERFSQSVTDIEKLLAGFEKTMQSNQMNIDQLETKSKEMNVEAYRLSLQKQIDDNNLILSKRKADQVNLEITTTEKKSYKEDTYLLHLKKQSRLFGFGSVKGWKLFHSQTAHEFSDTSVEAGLWMNIVTDGIDKILKNISDKPSDDDIQKLTKEIKLYRCETANAIRTKLKDLTDQKNDLDQNTLSSIWERSLEPSNGWILTWRVKQFNYSGICYDGAVMNCEGGEFSETVDKPSEGVFKTTFKSGYLTNGSATVNIMKKKNEIPDNKNKINALQKAIESFENKRAAAENEELRLEKQNQFLQTLIQEQQNNVESRSKSINELREKNQDLRNLSCENEMKKKTSQKNILELRAKIEEQCQYLEAIYIICEIVTIASNFTDSFMIGYKCYKENNPHRSNESGNKSIRFLCRWSNQLMTDPVYSKNCKDRHHFERTTIMEKLKGNTNTKCPICQSEITSSNLSPDQDLFNEIYYTGLAQTYHSINLGSSSLNTRDDLVTSIKQILELRELKKHHQKELDLAASKMTALNTLSEKFITPIIAYSKIWKVNKDENPPLFEIEFKHDTTEETINQVLSQISKDRPKQNTNKTDRTYKIPLEESEAIWLMEQIQRLSST